MANNRDFPRGESKRPPTLESMSVFYMRVIDERNEVIREQRARIAELEEGNRSLREQLKACERALASIQS